MNAKKATTLLSNLISAADIFNDPVYLNMKGRRKLATSLGGMLSAALIIFLLSQGIQQSISMFRRESPQVYQVTELEDDPTPIYLNSTNNFMFAIAISEYSKLVNLSQASPFSFTLTFNQYIRFTNGTRNKYKNKINLAPCTPDQFPESIYGQGVFESYGLNYAYCPINIDFNISGVCPSDILAQYPNCKTPLNFKLSGSFLSIDFEFIQFNLQACKATDKLPTKFKCLTGNISALLNSKEYKVNLFYANSVTNPMFYQTPNKTYIETIHWDLNPLLSKTADIFVDKEITQDYDSYFSSSAYENRTFYSIQPDKMRELQVFQTAAGLQLLQWNLRRSSNNIVTTRTYSKVQDVMTDLGGFSKAVMFIAAFVAIGYVEYKYQLTLSNEFYDFNIRSNKPPKRDKKKRAKSYLVKKEEPKAQDQEQELEDPKDLKLIENQNPIEKATQAVQEYFEEQKVKRAGIQFGLIKYFKMVLRWMFCRRNEEDEVAERARNLVQDELDIVRVIQKLKEIDKLKVLLLNRYQREVFNFIEKPLVTLENEKPIQLDSMLPDLSFELNESTDEDENHLNQGIVNGREEYDSLPKYAKLYIAYRYLTEDKHPENEKYNKKLMDMIGDDLISVFKKVDHVMDDNPDPRVFDEMIKKVFTSPEDQNSQE